MDKELGRLIDMDTPNLNPVIANGLAVRDMQQVENYIDSVFKAAARGFPEGLLYVNCSRCAPEEEFKQLLRYKNGKPHFDVARSDLYMMQYHFTFKGEKLDPRYLSLPIIGDAGTITLGGSRFTISPILSDRVISVGVSTIFVRLLKARLTFERMSYSYMMDGHQETVQVAWSTIYNKSNKQQKKLRNPINAKCTMMHYLLCKYGFEDTFIKYGNGCRPVVGGAEINTNTYPEGEWVICESAGRPPKGRAKGFWEKPQVKVAVRRSELTPMVRNMLGGFFYVGDFFPRRVLPDPRYLNSTRMWMIVLGHIIKSPTIGDGQLYDDMDDHMKSLDDYIDNLILDRMREVGLPVCDVYDLFALVVEHFDDWLLAAANKIASMYDKELAILYFVLFDITSAIFKLYFKLRAAAKKAENGKGQLTRKDIENNMNSALKQGLIYQITKTGNHPEISTVSVPGDNKAFKLTSLLVPQSQSNAKGKKDRAAINAPERRLHVSIAEIGGYLNLPKSQPDGRARLNPMVRTDPKGGVLRNEAFIDLTTLVEDMFKR